MRRSEFTEKTLALSVLDGSVIPTEVEYLEIGPGVTEIRGTYFAQNCNKLKEVILHEGLAQLGRVDSGCCFWGCSALVSVVFPSTLTNVSRSAFYNCKSLSSVVLPEGMTDLEQHAFSGCSSLASVMIPSSMKRIAGSKAAGSAFYGCNDLKTVFVTKGDEERVSEMLTRSGFSLTGVAVEAAQTVDGLRFPVPLSWADSYDGFEAKFGKDLSMAMMMSSGKKDAFGHDMLVWQDYVAGTDPTDETDLFKAMIDIVDGEVQISYWPELDTAKTALRRYVLMGKESLTDGEWRVVDDGDESAFRFFQYSVDMK